MTPLARRALVVEGDVSFMRDGDKWAMTTLRGFIGAGWDVRVSVTRPDGMTDSEWVWAWRHVVCLLSERAACVRVMLRGEFGSLPVEEL